jgi:hypothetical protein
LKFSFVFSSARLEQEARRGARGILRTNIEIQI